MPIIQAKAPNSGQYYNFEIAGVEPSPEELQRFNEARDVFTKASASKKDSVKKSARAWLQYTDNEQERVKNLNIRRESIS